MFRKPWFRILAWSLSSFFFFIAAGLLISQVTGASEKQVELWMMGMMQTMHQSMMGSAMADSQEMQALFYRSSALVVPYVAFGIMAGVIIRIWRGVNGTK
ncbi:MAG TPA: hypothetical protein VHS59_08610 [Bacillota bacterium]|nr:hypothetical protein [Bacillota bacterium]